MKIAIVDTYYPDVLKSTPMPETFEERQDQLMRLRFGTSDYYSDAFKAMGHEAWEIVGNDALGRRRWHDTWGRDSYKNNVQSVISELLCRGTNIVYCQDLNFFPAPVIRELKQRWGWKFVAQHSCPWAGDDRVSAFDLVFTSFPHYLARIERLGVRSHFLPIAFGRKLLREIEPAERDLEVAFVGGLNGGSGHWEQGTAIFEDMAARLGDRFKWWGYIIGSLPERSALARAYQGSAWGRDMYRIYARAKVVVNRHGEVADGYSNNMRMFEATGMGATLLTERSKNLASYFEPHVECAVYAADGHGILEEVNWAVANHERLGPAGQARTLKDHTYDKRLAEIEPLLRSMVP